MKKWDVFISHASEDKAAVAIPLVDALLRAGMRVWLDELELNLGDSLREKIDEGLALSTCGVVILSESFFAKDWPKKELNGLVALEDDRGPLILPVWHQIDKSKIAKYSPILADRVGVTTEHGIPGMAPKIVSAILKLSERTEIHSNPRVSRFMRLLKEQSIGEDLAEFFRAYPELLSEAFGHYNVLVHPSQIQLEPRLGAYRPDLSYGRIDSTGGGRHWTHLFFGPSSIPSWRTIRGVTKKLLDQWEGLESWLSQNKADASLILLGRKVADAHLDYHDAVVIVGRRDHMSEVDRDTIRGMRSMTLRARSYDWLIDVCAKKDRQRRIG